jgi:hypothetical protein
MWIGKGKEKYGTLITSLTTHAKGIACVKRLLMSSFPSPFWGVRKRGIKRLKTNGLEMTIDDSPTAGDKRPKDNMPMLDLSGRLSAVGESIVIFISLFSFHISSTLSLFFDSASNKSEKACPEEIGKENEKANNKKDEKDFQEIFFVYLFSSLFRFYLLIFTIHYSCNALNLLPQSQ